MGEGGLILDEEAGNGSSSRRTECLAVFLDDWSIDDWSRNARTCLIYYLNPAPIHLSTGRSAKLFIEKLQDRRDKRFSAAQLWLVVE
jgi:hypothetical protein